VTRDDPERLDDIRDACAEIAELVARGRAQFDGDRAVQLAIERLLEIVGEASNALAPATRERFPGVDWSGVTRLRVVLAHHYHRIDPELVWTMATDEIPALLSEARSSGSSPDEPTSS
jgi:uncharacterized protein with HEPN domain